MVLPQQLEGPGPRLINEGDLVIIYESYTSIKSVYINTKSTYSSRYGNFLHKDWVGMPYGSRAHSRPPGHGWVQLLAPTPELWTLVLRHRTQILYLADIAMVVTQLDLLPGCLVLESGTGSASLTHSLARAVAPHGRVRSFEFHELRAKEAAAELLRNGLPPTLASVEVRNIEERGFPDEELEGAADGVFLDLPGPWKVVASAAKCLKPNGRFCSFSPCIEQVQRTCEQLDACGMTDIVTFEVLLRNYEVCEETLLEPIDPEAVPSAAAEEVGSGAAAASAAAAAAAAAAEGPAPSGQPDVGQAAVAGAASRKRGRELDAEPDSGSGGGQADGKGEGAGGNLPQEQQQTEQQQDGSAAAQQQQQPDRQKGAKHSGPGGGRRQRQGEGGGFATRPVKMVVSRPSMDARGHTGYLTFARKFL